MKAVAVVIAFLGVAALFVMFPNILTSTKDLRTDDYEQTWEITPTGATHSVILGHDLWDDDIANVTSVSTDVCGDSPVANSYTASTSNLTIGGLSGVSCNLTVGYLIAGLEDYQGVEEASTVFPVIFFMAIIGVVLASLWKVFT